jgi:hypothetical protein
MIAPDLTVPEALVVLLGRDLQPLLVTAGVLCELELRGAIRCSDPGARYFGEEVRTSRFRLEILDRTPTGDDLLDATLVKAMRLVEQGAHVVGPDAMNRRLESIHLREGYVRRLSASGRLDAPAAPKGLLRRRAKASHAPDERRAMHDRLVAAVLQSDLTDPGDRALVALIAVSEGVATVGRPLWTLLAHDPRAGANAREREQTRLRTLERATALVDASPVAQAVELTLTKRPAGMDALD